MSAMIGNPLLLSPDGYQISRSVRLRSSASAYLNRTPSSTTNRTTWTWSGWRKRSNVGAWGALFASQTSLGAASNFEYITFRSDDTLQWVTYTTSTQANLITTQVFRDPSAWYHIVVSFDSTQATAANRVKIYVNGNQVTAFSTATYPSLNYSSFINLNQIHTIGRDNSGDYFDGYQTEDIFVDGQALTPSSFGETDAVTGVWKPKKYTGTYGTNGFYLNFSDNSAATAAAIGKDYSGNGNNWTPNNISLTAGATYDSMLDVPTLWADGGNGRGNYAVLNPLVVTNAAPTTFSEANLRVDFGASSTGWAHGTIGVTTGKWYAEFTLTSVSSTNAGVGLKSDSSLFYAGYSANSYAYENSGNKRTNDSTSAYGSSFTSGDVIGVAFDADAGTLTFYKNGTTQGQAFSSITGTNYFVVSDNSSSPTCVWQSNFGQRPFAYTPPTGFKALNTLNLPEPTIPNGRKFFDATTYTGTGNSLAVANGGFQPDLVWMKSRSNATSNALVDSSRGVTKVLYSQATDAETTWSDALTSFDANGFTIAANSTFNTINVSPRTYVGWQWKEGATNGFDIQAITAQASGSATFAHSLGVAPAMYIVKPRANAGGWNVYHQSLGATKVLALNGTGAAVTSSTTWNNTAPTSSVFSLGTDYAGFGTQIVYLFAEVPGFSKFGSYTGNGSADGPFVFCGFRPRWIMIKRTDSTQNWAIIDTARDTANVMNRRLFANLSDAEDQGIPNFIDVTANGFKCRDSNVSYNASGGTYIYAAFAENPFKYSLAR